MKMAIACDHSALELKEEVKALSIRDRCLEVQGFQRLGDG